MTRDEAIAKAQVDIGFGAYEKSDAAIFIDRLVALGVLKLDDQRHVRVDDIVGDLMAATISCRRLEIAIHCDDYDVRDRLLSFLTGSAYISRPQAGAA